MTRLTIRCQLIFSLHAEYICHFSKYRTGVKLRSNSQDSIMLSNFSGAKSHFCEEKFFDIITAQFPSMNTNNRFHGDSRSKTYDSIFLES